MNNKNLPFLEEGTNYLNGLINYRVWLTNVFRVFVKDLKIIIIDFSMC